MCVSLSLYIYVYTSLSLSLYIYMYIYIYIDIVYRLRREEKLTQEPGAEPVRVSRQHVTRQTSQQLNPVGKCH